MNILIEKSKRYQIQLHLLQIDYTKAFDLIDHQFLMNALEKQGVEETYIKIIDDMYSDLKARVIMDIEGPYFNIEKGVRQGDPLSSILFNCLLEEVFKTLDWQGKGINVNGEYLNNLRFADDVILIAKNPTELEEMVEDLFEKGQEAGTTNKHWENRQYYER